MVGFSGNRTWRLLTRVENRLLMILFYNGFCKKQLMTRPARVAECRLLLSVRRAAPTPCSRNAHLFQPRTLIAAPAPSQGPLMSRRSDRALPIIRSSVSIWLKSLPIFIGIITASSLAIFNYQKSSSAIVNATLYALRTNEVARRELGDQIYFRDKFPWIWGRMNAVHGRVEIAFGVKGTRAKGLMRFKSIRKTRMGFVSPKST